MHLSVDTNFEDSHVSSESCACIFPSHLHLSKIMDFLKCRVCILCLDLSIITTIDYYNNYDTVIIIVTIK